MFVLILIIFKLIIIIKECEDCKYENRFRCDVREGLVDVGWLWYLYVIFYIMLVYYF